jgi:hypothetical protein
MLAAERVIGRRHRGVISVGMWMEDCGGVRGTDESKLALGKLSLMVLQETLISTVSLFVVYIVRPTSN